MARLMENGDVEVYNKNKINTNNKKKLAIDMS